MVYKSMQILSWVTPSPCIYTIKHAYCWHLTCFLKLNFPAYLITLYFWVKQGVQTAPASSILHSSLRSLFLGFFLLAFLQQRLLYIFLEHKFAAFVFKLQAPVVQKVSNAMHWINLSIKRIVQLVSLILYVLWITISPVDKQLEPVSQS